MLFYNRAQTTALARELVSDSRVLIDDARLLVRNSSARIERIEKRLDRFVAAIKNGGGDARRGRQAALRRYSPLPLRP
jgi:hypothetical protein